MCQRRSPDRVACQGGVPCEAPISNEQTEGQVLIILALFAFESLATQPNRCIAAEIPHLSSTVERPARLLNPSALDGRFSELPVSRAALPDGNAMRALIPGVKWQARPRVSLAANDNLVGFVVDSTGVVVACSIRFRLPLADSASLITLLSGLRFTPAQIANENVPQLYVARLRR